MTMRGRLLSSLVVVCGLFLSTFTVLRAAAEIPRLMHYQGQLAEASGAPLSGDHTLTLRLYDAASGGSVLWEESHTVSLKQADQGVFSLTLGSVTAFPATLDFNQPIWLTLDVDATGEMLPRQRLTAVTYAINADQLDGLDSTQFLRADINTATSGRLTLTNSGVALLIKPLADPSANTTLLDIQNAAGTSQFSADLEGDVAAAGSLTVGTNLAVGTDLTVTSGMRIGTGSTGTNITALADDTLFVEGDVEIDGTTFLDGALTLADSATVDGLDLSVHAHTGAAGHGVKLDHGAALTGVLDDDHTQYALLAGRAAGQTLIGGTGSGDDLILRSTSNATKGDVLLADQGGNVGIGTTSPQSALQVSGYVQLAVTSRAPPAADCDAAAEEGRMLFDPATKRLYVCGASGWTKQTFANVDAVDDDDND